MVWIVTITEQNSHINLLQGELVHLFSGLPTESFRVIMVDFQRHTLKSHLQTRSRFM